MNKKDSIKPWVSIGDAANSALAKILADLEKAGGNKGDFRAEKNIAAELRRIRG